MPRSRDDSSLHRRLVKVAQNSKLLPFSDRDVFTFRVSCRRREIYSYHGRLYVCVSVCLSVPRRIPTLLRGPGCNFREWYGNAL